MNKFLVYTDVLLPALAFVAGVLYLLIANKKITVLDAALLLFLLLQIVLNTVANYLQNHSINNHRVYILNSLFTQVLFTNYFYNLFTDAKKRLYITLSFQVYAIFLVFNTLFIQPFNTFPSYPYAFGALIIVLLGWQHLILLVSKVSEYNIVSLKEFWASAGMLFYFGSSFFIFISYHYLSITAAGSVGILWKLHNIFLIVGCILFFKAITCKKWIVT